MIGSMEQGSTSASTSACTGNGTSMVQPKQKVFLSHSGAQKGFVEQLCVDLERCDRHAFFDKRRDCLPIGDDFPRLIFEAIEQCEVGVVVLSKEFFTSKWPMLELVAMMNLKKRKPSFTIMPVLLGLSLSQCRDVDNHKRWLSLWLSWAESDNRIILIDWANALELFGSTNALKYNFELGEVKFRDEIVDSICRLVLPRTRLEDSHIQGRSRLCKVIHEKIKQSKVSSRYGVHVIGLHGFGGIGKTTLCKAMYNDVFEEFRGKVAHMELGSCNEEELLKDVLRSLTELNLERLGVTKVDQLRYHVKRDMMNVKVFLAIDNVSSVTRDQALTLLQANYGHGSVVLVTARSLSDLMSLGIYGDECIELPELEMEEARSLFLHHAIHVPSTYLSNKDDHDLVMSCVQRCYFKKGDGISYHYHPLALQTLGVQLSCIGYVPERWKWLLHEVDFLNPSRERQHPVFSILRSSFEALNYQDQLLFMDVTLYRFHDDSIFSIRRPSKCSVLKWLGMVHGIPETSVIERLENLKRKSLLENVGIGFDEIGMHDLWREFARLEAEVGDFKKRQWMFEYNALEEASVTNGGPWMQMKRMFFLNKGFVKLEDVNFHCFPNVTVLKLSLELQSTQILDLRGLKQLKSLDLDFSSKLGFSQDLGSKRKPLISIVGLGFLSKLIFLRWVNRESSLLCINEIGGLTNLQVLELYHCGGILDLSNLHMLQLASFGSMDSLATIVGFNLNHTNLEFLDLSYCKDLKSCLSMGELVALQELCLHGCWSLEELPNLKKLKQLRKLDVHNCKLLQGFPSLGDLVSLVELKATSCNSLVELPDMRNLINLKILEVRDCKLIKSLLGLNELVCLQSLYMWDCDDFIQLPDMQKLTNLQNLEFIGKQPLQSFVGLSNLISLQSLHIRVDEVHDASDLRNLTTLTSLAIAGLEGQGLLSLGELVLLESATIVNCKGVHVLPDHRKLSRLFMLDLEECEFEDMSSLSHFTSLELLTITKCHKLEVLPDLRELAKLEMLVVRHCARLRDVHGILGLQNFQRLQSSGDLCLHEDLCSNCPRLAILRACPECGHRFANQQVLDVCLPLGELTISDCPILEFPNLAHFPELSYLNITNCVSLTNLTSRGPVSSTFEELYVSGCTRLQALPDLTNSKEMRTLDVANSGVMLSIHFIQDMKARWPSMDLIN